MKNKHIDVIVKYFYPVVAGIETNILETYSILAKEGWDITIHTSKDVYMCKNCLSDKEKYRGLRIVRYKFSFFGFFPKIDWSNTSLVCLHNFDVFPHFRILIYSLYLKILDKKYFGLILTPHGGFNPEWSIYSKAIGFIKKLYHFTFGAILINLVVDGIRAVSDWEKEEIISKNVKKELVVVIDNGIETEAFLNLEKLASKEIKNQVSIFGDYIIQIGRIYPIKNYETTIIALNSLPKNLKYIIVGPISDKKYFDNLNILINKFNLNDRVKFVGVIKGIDKYYLIKHAQMMVHMALWESFCNVVHEGLSQGLVCIVANNTALPYLVKDGINGYCVETKDFNELAKKINFVLKNKETPMIKEMEEINRNYGRINSWKNVANKMNSFYKYKLNMFTNHEKLWSV